MLNTLRKIVQEVNSAKDLKAALGIIVLRVKEAMGSQVCSVYLLDPETNRFVLMATEGLNKRSIGKVSMAPNEGLVGLVGTREEPLNLENAADHPRYRYFAETGEERYASFLGAPIIHHRRVVGVLVIQQKERRQFDEGEEAFLVTMSAQLAGVIAHAEATGSIRGLGRQGKGIQEAKFVGVPGSPGAAVGTAVVMLPPADLDVVPDKTISDIDAELGLFKTAIEGVRADMRALSAKLATQLRPEERALFDVYLMMLDDASLGSEVTTIIKTGQWAQGALRQVVTDHVNRFELMDDAYLRERASDVKDLGRRLLAYLQEERQQTLVYPDNTILISEELTPAMLGEVPEGKLVGLVSVLGSGNSHVAILARAMGIPTVMGLVDLPYSKVDGIQMIVLLFLPWLPGLIDLVLHMDALEVGGDVGWEPAVTLRSMPSMLWQLMAQDDAEGMPLWLLLTLPGVLVAMMVYVVCTDRSRYRFATLVVLYSALPLLVLYGVSFVSPVFIERYLTAPALGLAIILALGIDRLARRFKVLALALLLAVLAVEGVGLKNNYTVDADDQFNDLVAYMNRHTQAGDQVVLGDMFWYLTWGYYDQSATAPRLYTPPTAAGVSTRPNSYGFGTLIDENAGVYLDHLQDLPQGNGRVWLVMSREAPDEFPSIPSGWRKIDQHAGGDTQAVLYEACHVPCGTR